MRSGQVLTCSRLLMNTLSQIPLPLFYAASGLLGLAVGSFLNVVILRLPVVNEAAWRRECREFLNAGPGAGPDVEPHGKPGAEPHGEPGAQTYNLISPGSSCPRCGHRLALWENIPVLSYLMLRGRCAACNGRISWRYPFVELLTALLTLAVAVKFGISPQALCAGLFTWALIALAFIDIDYQLLPDNITLPCLWLGLLCNWFGLYTDLHSAVLGAAAGYGIFWLVYHCYKLATGKEGMGLGDLKLLAMLGAWSGWQALASIIFLSSLLGSLVGLYLVFVRRRARSAPISFGPFLALAGWLSLVWGLDIFDYSHTPGSG